jgi:hypothetical protein
MGGMTLHAIRMNLMYTDKFTTEVTGKVRGAMYSRDFSLIIAQKTGKKQQNEVSRISRRAKRNNAGKHFGKSLADCKSVGEFLMVMYDL